MISIIITAYKEPNTIAKAIKSIVRPFYSGITDEFELIQVSPDDETLQSGIETVKGEKWIKDNFIQIKDPQKGKPYALNLAFEKARGDILILTDGDVYFDKNAVSYLLSGLHNPEIGGVTGRPVPIQNRDTMMGYYANLLCDAAHDKRLSSMNGIGSSDNILVEDKFFPLSGYIMAIKNIKFKLPEDVLADDAYISYLLHKEGYKVAYAPNAKVFVKYPKNLSDYLIQKKRSLGGYIQLKNFGISNAIKQSRSFKIELQYLWFPINYAKKFNEFIWSLFFYPIRLWTWINIWWERVVINKSFNTTWVRVESTK
jgi:poly-beta-1,6-N-acetyl-D-glucosamine synthase